MPGEASQYVTETVADTTKLLKKQVRPIVAACNKTAYDVQKFGALLDETEVDVVTATNVRRHGRTIVKNLNKVATQR
ncbi:MAG: hypothetical protein PHR86_10430 [Desulfobacterales bacterium]|jgi:hypothetical protein|nr:hypothetical protein [Desulfobacterales bacterium]